LALPELLDVLSARLTGRFDSAPASLGAVCPATDARFPPNQR
jgi:hypothetical protein